MYVFDVTCGIFSLLALYCYVSNRWILSLIAFYTAYRCKEMAIMLPLVLALYEFWFGKRAWKRLIPFFALSLCFGIQAVLHNSTAPKNDYSMTHGRTLHHGRGHDRHLQTTSPDSSGPPDCLAVGGTLQNE